MSRAESDDFIEGIAALSVGHDGRTAPEGWAWTKLTTIAKLESGHTPSRKYPEYWAGDVPWISIPDARVNHGRVIHTTDEYVTEEGLANSAARWLPKDTVCLSRTASVGYVTRLGRPMATSQDFVNWICGEALEPSYLMYALMAEGKHIREFGKGSTHTTIYFPEVLAFHVALPPLAEQRRIVAKVDELLAEVNAAKERLAKVPAILKRFRQAVLAAACAGKLTEEWHPSGELSSESSSPSVDLDAVPELPELPTEWRLATIGEVADSIRYGCNEKADSDARGIPMLRMGNIQEGRVDLADLKFVRRAVATDDFRVRRGDLLFNRTNSPELVGKAAVYDHDGEAIFASYLVRVRLNAALAVPEYVEAWIMSPWGRAWARHVRTDGVSQSNINATKLAEMPLPLPGLDEQREIVRRLRGLLQAMHETGEQAEAAHIRVANATQAILCKAFRGELVPTEAELARAERREYETAEQLLARVLGAKAEPDDSARAGKRRAGSTKARRKKQEPEADGVLDDHDDTDESGKNGSGSRVAAAALEDLDDEARHAAVFAALWPHGPTEKDAAVRVVAEHLRDAGNVSYQRLRADGPLYAAVLGAIEAAAKAGVLDRPRRGYVRAIKDPQTMTADDWRHALVTSLDGEPVEREVAIRCAAEWARENLGVAFERLRTDGHIVVGLRSAINSAIRRGEVVRHGATHIARAAVTLVTAENVEPYRPGIDGTFNPPPPRLRSIEHRSEPRVVDGDKPVLVLQSDARGDELEIHYLAMMTLAAALSTATDTSKRAGWTFYLALDRPHVEGLSTWLGIGPGVPAQVVDLLQKLLESTRHRVGREYAAPARHDLAPFLVATDDAIEFTTRLDDDVVREHFEDALLIRRPLVSRAGKAAKLGALFFGSDAE
ncbi:MAG: hypothetical protein F9K40_04185 [Kofleriaceae bacterium]|nr:MAG: hypothetical protein F9K40_04185 [Kofleriaceae bacterium]